MNTLLALSCLYVNNIQKSTALKVNISSYTAQLSVVELMSAVLTNQRSKILICFQEMDPLSKPVMLFQILLYVVIMD